MRHLRAISRLALVAGLTAVCWPAWLLCRLARPLAPAISRRGCDALLRIWARSVAAGIGMRLSVSGEPPPPPYFLVCNHLSYVDVLVLWSRLDCTFLSRADVAQWPVVGLLARSVGTLFVDRGRRADLPRVIAELRRILGQRRGVVVFPEGTSSSGASVLTFKPSLFEVAALADLPVSYAAISYRTSPRQPSAREAVCWWGDMTFLPHIYALLGLSSFQATLAFGARPLVAADRKELAREAQRAVSAEFTPVPAASA